MLDTLTADLYAALKLHDKIKTETLRFLIAAIKKYEIDTYPPGSVGALTEADSRKILARQIKSHVESIAAFEKGGRRDLVEKESAELKILEQYVPKQLSDDQIILIVKQFIGSSGKLEFGSIMGKVMQQVKGKARGDRVAQIVKRELDQK